MMKKDLTLVILAAGMGSRFGGLKQVEPVGPNAKGELMICDEMGKLNGSKINQKATDWYWKSFGPYDVIVGNVVICDDKQFK